MVAFFDYKELPIWDIFNYATTFIMIFSGAIGIVLLIFVFVQIYLISNGKTTNEYVRSKANEVFDDGCMQNWRNTFNDHNEG